MRQHGTRTDRVWFITGASRGFGRALSEAVLARGERLVATARGADFVSGFGGTHPDALVLRLEPGPHRTEFASEESARSASPIDDYAETVGAAREAFAQLDGTQPGDPQRAALAILAANEKGPLCP